MRLWRSVIIVLCVCSRVSRSRRRVSAAERAFEKNEGLDWALDESEILEKESKDTTTSATESAEREETSPAATTSATEPPTSTEVTENTGEGERDVISQLLLGAFDIMNITTEVESDESDDETNKTVLWIDASYKAENYKLNVTLFPECKVWQEYWSTTVAEEEEKSLNASDAEDGPNRNWDKDLKESELIDNEERLKEVGLSEGLLEEYKAVGLLYKEICGDHGRVLWFRDTTDAKNIGITESSPICEPFMEELTPDSETLISLARTLNELVLNFTLGIIPETSTPTVDEAGAVNNESVAETITLPEKQSEDDYSRRTAFLVVEGTDHTRKVEAAGRLVISPAPVVAHFPRTELHAQAPWRDNNRIDNYDDVYTDYGNHKVKYSAVHDPRGKRSLPSTEEENVKKSETQSGEDEEEDEWLFSVNPSTTKPEEENVEDKEGREVNATEFKWVNIEHTDGEHPTLFISSAEAVEGLALKIPVDAFLRFEKIGLYLPGICADYVPKAIDEFNSSSFEGVEIEGPIGVNISALEAAGVNLTALAEKLRNDTEVDEILSRTNGSTKTLGGSFILPVLNKNKYDPFSAPIVFQGSAVVVRFGIYIESMSNFQTSTMDYDMDIYLMMSWRDARLVNPYDKPILVKEEEILEKIWRPDPFFANAKEAEFHEVTFLNFLMRIFPDGLVLYETRVKIKPSCNLILCKYPHDKQTCDLLIKSFAYPVETVRFEWFTRRVDAIDKNPDVKLPELYIDRYEPMVCTKARKSGAFSCLRAVFRLKRDVGFHIAQTYIPTSLALMFSWVGVWLPEEFMEGRIGVAITVLLTLSTESAGAREHLPSVSYLKAIDLWFGFITGFVFFTLLQTLFVIGFDKRANQLKKWAMKRKSDITEEVREMMLLKGDRYHKAGRYLDNFCRVFYPLSFVLFLIMYYFVFTEGRQDECINRR